MSTPDRDGIDRRFDEEEPDSTGQVPAGGAGADSGAVDAVGVDPEDEASIGDISSQNDIPGVGTRAPDPDQSDNDRGAR